MYGIEGRDFKEPIMHFSRYRAPLMLSKTSNFFIFEFIVFAKYLLCELEIYFRTRIGHPIHPDTPGRPVGKRLRSRPLPAGSRGSWRASEPPVAGWRPGTLTSDP